MGKWGSWEVGKLGVGPKAQSCYLDYPQMGSLKIREHKWVYTVATQEPSRLHTKHPHQHAWGWMGPGLMPTLKRTRPRTASASRCPCPGGLQRRSRRAAPWRCEQDKRRPGQGPAPGLRTELNAKAKDPHHVSRAAFEHAALV